MTPAWKPNPSFKLETNGQTFINETAFFIELVRPLNNVSYLVLRANDYQSKNYIDVFNKFYPLTLSLRYGSDSWAKVFSGVIDTVAPKISRVTGEILECSVWGEGHALIKTHCCTSYGAESKNPTKDTPKEILDDLVDNYINKRLGTASTTGYNITKTKIADIHNDLSITHISSPYLNNFTVINRICDIVTAHVGEGNASCHWFVDPDKNLFINTVGNHEEDGTGWDTYWGGSQAASTIEVKKDMILYDFQDQPGEYVNVVVLAADFRKPGYDYWTEDQHELWGHTVDHIELADSGVHIVGSFSLSVRTPDVVGGFFWYPSGKNAGWDFTKIGSEKTIPSLNFYARRSNAVATFYISVNTDALNFVDWNFVGDLTSADKWYHFSLPVGPYYDRQEQLNNPWNATGTIDWSNINYIEFAFDASVNNIYGFIDDLHLSGKIIREALDSGDAGLYDDYQKFFRCDYALDDTMIATNDSGTAAQLAYAELLRRNKKPIVGVIQIPLAVTVLPGQLIHTRACKKSNGTFRIDKDMRIKELKHVITLPEPMTVLNLTDDVTNAHAMGAPTQHSVLAEYVGALGHGEARDLKSSGVDILIPRLIKSY